VAVNFGSAWMDAGTPLIDAAVHSGLTSLR
jgi:hypothetical protein